MPTVDFSISLKDSVAVTYDKYEKACIESCSDCGCDDQLNLRCFHENQIIVLTPNVTVNGTPTYKWYVDNVEVATGSGNKEIKFTISGAYDLKLEVADDDGTCSKIKTVVVNDIVQLERVDCSTFKILDFRLADSSNNIYSQMRIKITDVNGKVIAQYLKTNHTVGEVNFKIPKEGISIVEYAQLDSGGQVLYSKKFIALSGCSVLECHKKILLSIMCSGPNCPDKKQNIDILTEFTVLNAYYNRAMDVLYGKTANQLFYEDKYLSTVKNIDLMYNRLLRLCGKCYELTELKTSSCVSCNDK